MNITFFIGNGFDLNLDLNTRYSDFYPFFIKNASKDNMIKKWLKEDELLWSDLEEKLGENLQKVEKQQKEKFYDDKAELDSLLLEYLEKEQDKIITEGKEDKIAEEFSRSMITYYNELSELGKSSIRSTYDIYKAEEFKYCFISFNYTNVLDRFMDITLKKKAPITTHTYNGYQRNNSLGSILHIHGTINEEMILGVNDTEQIFSDFLKKDEEFLDTFIKRRMNVGIGQKKIENAKKIIEESHVICIFGMSIGNTDKIWWKEVINWLNNNKNNKLIIYYKGFEEIMNKKIPSRTIRLNNSIKKDILEKGKTNNVDSVVDDIKNRIFISYNANIFNFSDIKDKIVSEELLLV